MERRGAPAGSLGARTHPAGRLVWRKDDSQEQKAERDDQGPAAADVQQSEKPFRHSGGQGCASVAGVCWITSF